MKNQTQTISISLIFIVFMGCFASDDSPIKTSHQEPDQAHQIYGVHCRLLPEKDKWRASEVPKFKAYVPAPGHAGVWLAAIAQQNCRLQINNQWYRYIHPEWTGGISVHAKTDWLVEVGGFLTVSLDRNHWVSLRDSRPLVLNAGQHSIRIGWAGHKEDPTGKRNREDNPILLISKPARIQILESKKQAKPARERLHKVTELFNSYVQRKPITKAQQKRGLRTDLRLFHGWKPKFTWEDIPALLEIARNDRLIEGMPSEIFSSYIGQYCRKGMIALWLIEGLRREQLSLQREKQLGEKLPLHIAHSRLPLNPICLNGILSISECERSSEIHKTALQAYQTWWQAVGSLPATQAAVYYPFDLFDIEWYGAPDHWLKEPLKTYETISSDGTVAKRIIRQSQRIKDNDEYEPGNIMQTVYYTLRNPEAKAPFTPKKLKIKKIVLYYYDTQGNVTRTEDVLPIMQNTR